MNLNQRHELADRIMAKDGCNLVQAYERVASIDRGLNASDKKKVVAAAEDYSLYVEANEEPLA